jgi:hypothetical protein
MWPCIVTNFFTRKPTRFTNFPNLLRYETLHVLGNSSAHHQEFIHAVPSWSCSKAVFKPVWPIPVPSVQWINSWWWAEELPKTCRVSYRSKFGKLVHLVGFITSYKEKVLRVSYFRTIIIFRLHNENLKYTDSVKVNKACCSYYG